MNITRNWLINFVALLLALLSFACHPVSPTPHPTHTPGPNASDDLNHNADTILRMVYPTVTVTPLPPQTWIPPNTKDSIPMVRVPAGPFLMGSTLEQIKTIDSQDYTRCSGPRINPSTCRDYGLWTELPQHRVDLPEYSIDQTEVTNAQYRRCLEAGICPDISEEHAATSYWINRNRQRLHDSRYDQYPARVQWAGAESYCQWVNKRLPTEAEWEKAARGADGRAYPWGNNWKPEWANFGGNDQPVGSYPEGSSPYGALDMAGNAPEWVSNYPALYPDAKDFIPSQVLNLLSRPSADDDRGVRGLRSPLFYETRVSMRRSSNPEEVDALFGFRCVYSQ